jgi:hypothetical protein
VNTGLREQEVVNLRWAWERREPELKDTSVFIIPRDFVKNGLDRYVVQNRIARSVIGSCRKEHPEFVFTRNGRPVAGINNSAPELGALIRASEMVCGLGSRKSPAIAIVRATAESAK